MGIAPPPLARVRPPKTPTSLPFAVANFASVAKAARTGRWSETCSAIANSAPEYVMARLDNASSSARSNEIKKWSYRLLACVVPWPS